MPAARLGRFDHVSRTAPGFFFFLGAVRSGLHGPDRGEKRAPMLEDFSFFGDGEKGRGKLQFIYV